MNSRLLAASAALMALLTASLLGTAGQEKKGGDAGKDPDLRQESKLVGLAVVDKEGDQAGTVKDTMVDLSNGKIIYFVVQTGGVAGVGGQYHAVAPGALRLTVGQASGRELFAIDVDDKKLKDAKGFDTNNWPRQPTWGPGGKEGEGKEGGPGDKDTLERTSNIKRLDVHSAKTNDDLGDVYDLMINTKKDQWKIHYAAISRGGPVAGKLYAVAWDALKLKAPTGATGSRVFVLDATKADFERSPGFTSDETWPANPTFKAGGGGKDKERD